jgi:hypothetical protein
MTIQIQRTSENGKFGGEYQITAQAGENLNPFREWWASRTRASLPEDNGSSLKISVTNRGERDKLYDLARAAEMAAVAAQAPQPAAAATGAAPYRVVVPCASTQVGSVINGHVVTGLGRAWVASLRTIDEHGLHPQYEGELVCYAYFTERR